MASTKRSRKDLEDLMAAVPGALATAVGLSLEDRHRRIKGKLELEMEAAAVRRRRNRAAKGITPESRTVPRHVQWEPAQSSKRARKAAGVRGRKASKRFYRQFKRQDLADAA